MKVDSMRHIQSNVCNSYVHKPKSLPPAAIQYTYAVRRLPACNDGMNIFERVHIDERDGGESRE